MAQWRRRSNAPTAPATAARALIYIRFPHKNPECLPLPALHPLAPAFACYPSVPLSLDVNMSRYTSETPMDFEFQNGTGPLDGRSPFAQVSANSQRLPQSSPSKKSEQHRVPGRRAGHKLLTTERPGTHGVFDSPSKARPMGVQPSSPEKRLPPLPAAYNTLFNTPRKPRDDFDDSSAGETPQSVEPKDDSDATPENTNRTRTLLSLQNNRQDTAGAQRRRSPTKDRPAYPRRDSLLFQLATKVKNKMYSPGRGELVRKDHSGAIEKSVARRRKRDVDQRVAKRRRHSMSDSADDHDGSSRSPRKGSKSSEELDDRKPYWVSSLFSFVAQHPTLPNTLSQYAQFLFNVFWLGILAYMTYSFLAAVMGDVDKASKEAMTDVIREIALCKADYERNKCERSTRVPAVEAACEEWHRCMSRDPKKVGRAMVSARTFAQIFNNFVEPISYKAMAFTCILVFGCFAISNLAFGFFRHKMQEFQPAGGYGPPPPTPQRTFSGQDGSFYAGGTPWHQPPPAGLFEPQPSGGFGQIDGQGSPQRRLVYN